MMKRVWMATHILLTYSCMGAYAYSAHLQRLVRPVEYHAMMIENISA